MDYKVAYRVENIMNAPELSGVSLDGVIGSRFDRFAYERVSGRFAVDEILREAELFFLEQYDDEYSYGLWRSEFWGKLMISACRTCRMKDSKTLREDIEKSVYTVLSYADENGYISAYRNPLDLLPADSAISMRDVNWACDYNWNLWGQKYTLWALLEAAMLLDDESILKGAVKLADNLINALNVLGKRVKDAGVMVGMAASSILKPMLILYRLTGDEKYLSFALGIAKELDREDGEMPNLVANAFSGKSIPEWYSAEDGWVPKAYEMTSTYDGLIELYRVTGNRRYLDCSVAFWEILYKYELNVLGSAGYCERYENASSYPDSATEICDVIHWMRLSYELFALTGERRYVSAFEKAFLNAFLAGVYESGRGGAFFVRSAGRHYIAEAQVETKYQNCCLNNVARGFVNAAQIIASERDGEIYINTYIQSKVRFGKTSIKISNGYTDSLAVAISIRGGKVGDKLHFMIPEWASAIRIMHEGVTTECDAPLSYASITVTKDEMLFYLTFVSAPVLSDFKGEFTRLSDDDYHVRRWCDSMNGFCDRTRMVTSPMSVIYNGPILLARSKRFGSTPEDMFSGKTVCGRGAKVSLVPVRHDHLLAGFKVTLKTEDETVEYYMCDFSSASNSDFDSADNFTVFV